VTQTANTSNVVTRVRGLSSRALVALCVILGALSFLAASAQAAVTHELLPTVTAELNEPLPVEGLEAEPPPTSFGAIASMTVDAGELYVAQGTEKSKIDKFDASTGAFLSQLPRLTEPLYLHQGVAVGHSTGEAQLYVAGDIYPEGKPLGGVAVLTPQGSLKSVWSGADTPAGHFDCFECGGPVSVAVDDSTNLTDSAAGDVYVMDEGNDVVDVFKPQAGGGEKYVGQLTGPEPPGVLFPHLTSIAVNQTNGEVIVNAGEAVYLFRPAPIAGQYEFAGTLTSPPGQAFQRLESIATDGGNGDIYLTETHVVYEYNSNGEYVGDLTGTAPGTPFSSIKSVAVNPVSHNVYVAVHDEKAENKPSDSVDAFGPDIVTPDVINDEASGVAPHGVTLHGEVNPRGEGQASCRFVYGTSPEFGQAAPCEPEQVVDGSSYVPVHALLSGLESDTTYFYRLQATNQNGTNPGEAFQDRQFTTPGPGMHGESVSSVSSTSATLNATINPDKEPTSFYFQYGKSSEYEAAVPLAPGAPLGAGEADVEVNRHLQSLTAETVYHYRVVAVSEPQAGVTETFVGPDQTFTTQRSGTAFVLPDDRGWELVSPPNKHGARILPISGGWVEQSSRSGEAITYKTSGTTEGNPPGYATEEQVFTSHTSGGWSTKDIGLPHRSESGIPIGIGEEYRFFSEDLSASLLEPQGEFTSLAPEVSPPDSERTLYVRHNFTCAATPETCYEPLVTGAPGYADVPEGTEFGGNPNQIIGPLRFKGATPDLQHVIFASEVGLTSLLAKEGLYEWSAGKTASEELRLVSLLPKNGGPAAAPEFGDTNPGGGSARNAISADGTRIVWTEAQGHLYMRDTSRGSEGETLQLDVVQAGAPGNGEIRPQFQIASSDGSRVFFTDEQRLTMDSGASHNSPDLYECEIVEVADELQCKLSDITPVSQDGQGANVLGVLGTSEDGSSIYYVAERVLAEGAVADGSNTSDNLYVSHYDGTSWEVPRLIAGLSNEDDPDWNGQNLEYLTARVSPDGNWVAFMSQRQLTSYNNRDVVSGKPDEEVYLYDASGDGGAGSVVCGSCRPTGARPEGVEYARVQFGAQLAIRPGTWSTSQYIAANIPGWTAYNSGQARYQSHYLSDSGRLFFDATDALVPQDINNNEDVYEFEPVGVGDCAATSSTFSVASGGCVGMISSGTATGESAFVDVSGSGDDVFFLTGEKLVPEDVDTSLDLYDAHVCSSGWSCPDVASVPPPCTTAEACRAAPSPQPAIFGSPASATFSGAGNVTESGATAGSVKPKTLTRAQKLEQALKVCRKRKKGKRAACERQARGLYGAKAANKHKTTKKKGR
jgi:WD40-like Beta Propeller Repeat